MEEAGKLFKETSAQFSGELYKKIIEGQNENVVFSPISIQNCVSLALLGASGETAEEIKKALQFSKLTIEQLKEASEKFTNDFKSGTSFSIGTKMLVQQGLDLKSSFSETAIKCFDAIAENMDFSNNVDAANKINDWISQKTADKIHNLVDPQSINGLTAMILVNAVYFKGTWVDQFNPDKNFSGKFYLNETNSVDVEFMTQRYDYNYTRLLELDCSVIELLYENSNASFLIFLPNTKTGLTQLEEKVSNININEIKKKMELYDIEIELPKFKIEYKIDLMEALKKLGIQKAFTDLAEFDGIFSNTGNVKITDVVHKTFIEVNEKGTEAAAATALGIECRSMPLIVSMDHPFLFVIQANDYPMFMGRCNYPTMNI